MIGLFLLMSVIWGLTWIAIKTGVAAVPPFCFAALRLVTAGSLLLLVSLARGKRVSMQGSGGRVVLAALLVNTATYGALFWGMQYVPSGISAVVNLSLIPIGLFTLGLIAKEETFSLRKLLALIIGITGLVLLFLPKVRGEARPELAGMLVIVFGTLACCFGSILSRPLLRRFDTMPLAGLESLIGGMGLAGLSLAFEPVGFDTLRAFATLPVLASWAFLVLGGSVAAFTIYLALLRDWGPSRAGLYAFVSPIIALALGVVLFDETLGGLEITGSVVMLVGAGVAISGKRSSPPERFPSRARNFSKA